MKARRVGPRVVVGADEDADVERIGEIDVVDRLRFINFAEVGGGHDEGVTVARELDDIRAREVEALLFGRPSFGPAKLKRS